MAVNAGECIEIKKRAGEPPLFFASCSVAFLCFPFQHPSGEGLHGAVLHRFAGLDHQVEKAAGDLPLAQLLFNAQGALFSKKQESRTERSGIEVCTT